MIAVQQAVVSAKEYAASLLGKFEWLLEEIHSKPEVFEITLSMPDRRADSVNPLVARARLGREYKVFDVSKESGEVLGMSIRTFNQ